MPLHERHWHSFYGNCWVSAAVSKDAVAMETTLHMDGKTITHTGGSAEVFIVFRVQVPGREGKQAMYDIKPNFIIFLTYIDC